MKTKKFILIFLSLFLLVTACEYDNVILNPQFEQIAVDSSWSIYNNGDIILLENNKKVLDTVCYNHNKSNTFVKFTYIPEENITIKERIDTIYKYINL